VYSVVLCAVCGMLCDMLCDVCGVMCGSVDRYDLFVVQCCGVWCCMIEKWLDVV